MSPHNVVKPFRRAGIAQQVVAVLFANRAILLTDGGHLPHDTIFDQSQARSVVRFPQLGHIGADVGDAGFNAPVSLADLSILGQRVAGSSRTACASSRYRPWLPFKAMA